MGSPFLVIIQIGMTMLKPMQMTMQTMTNYNANINNAINDVNAVNNVNANHYEAGHLGGRHNNHILAFL